MIVRAIVIITTFRLHLIDLAIAKHRESDSRDPSIALAIEACSHSDKYICFFEVKCTSIISLIRANDLPLPVMILYPKASQVSSSVTEDFDV